MAAQRKIYLKRMARLYRKVLMVLVSDQKFLIKKCKKEKGMVPNLEDPKTLTEKLLYLMIHYRNPLEKLCADKYYVQEYIKACGLEYILKPIYGVYSKAEEIDFDSLPEEYFIKCNHVSGNNMIIKKSTVTDYDYLKKFYAEVMKLDYYTNGREYQYHNIRPLVICEKCLRDSKGDLPIDYKFYCFNGEPRYFMVSLGEFDHEVRNHKFDMECNSIDHYFKKEATLQKEEVQFPDNLEEMFSIVRKLCRPFPHVRVDLYNVEGKIYFGELTFTSNGGLVNIYDKKFDEEVGSWIHLDEYKTDMV